MVMHPDATEAEVPFVVERLRVGAEVSVATNEGRIMLSGSIEGRLEQVAPWDSLPGVERVVSTVPGVAGWGANIAPTTLSSLARSRSVPVAISREQRSNRAVR